MTAQLQPRDAARSKDALIRYVYDDKLPLQSLRRTSTIPRWIDEDLRGGVDFTYRDYRIKTDIAPGYNPAQLAWESFDDNGTHRLVTLDELKTLHMTRHPHVWGVTKLGRYIEHNSIISNNGTTTFITDKLPGELHPVGTVISNETASRQAAEDAADYLMYAAPYLADPKPTITYKGIRVQHLWQLRKKKNPTQLYRILGIMPSKVYSNELEFQFATTEGRIVWHSTVILRTNKWEIYNGAKAVWIDV